MRRGRLPIVVLLIISLLTAGAARRWAQFEKTSANHPLAVGNGNAGNLSRMNSFALALLLGGLRGPLVMFLWPSAEQQKNEKNLEDFDTKIEWIRLLQAEFDSVHIFQIWNKAYNIPVQMTNIGNKYAAILSAIDYGRDVDQERPNDINIVDSIGHVYADKLGNTPGEPVERTYYRQRVRDETQARKPMMRITFPASRRDELVSLGKVNGLPSSRMRFVPTGVDNLSITIPKALASIIQPKFTGPDVKYADVVAIQQNRDDPQWHRRELDPILDDKGYLLPQYITPKFQRPADLPADSDWNDGSDLQYLKPFQPFLYGVSPQAIGYNYLKRAQVLQNVNKQKHAQTTPLVVDSRPALTLREWANEEWDHGRRTEIEGFGKKVPLDRPAMEQSTAVLPFDTPIESRQLIDEAIYSYGRSDQIAQASLAEYQSHLERDKTNFGLYTQHMEEIEANRRLVTGDRNYLQAMTNSDGAAVNRTSAAASYRDSIRRYKTLVLKYYVPDEIVPSYYPIGITRANVAEANLPQNVLDQTFASVRDWGLSHSREYANIDDLVEYLPYIARAEARLAKLTP
ncbi:MAG TPA: hypothetical protein VHD56_12700 [Tepidisphaeraceae bacterium]|nr:hypothetical protein [Tepidisphaeraceae bacterium]